MATETSQATSEFKPIATINPGACLLINGRVARVTELLIRDVGRAGKPKVRVVGQDVFDGRRVEEIFANTQTIVECPFVEEKVFQLADISVDELDPVWYRVTLLDEYGKEKEPLMVPRYTDGVLYSQGLYSPEDVEKARAMKIAFDEEAKKGPDSARTIAVTTVQAMNKEVFKDWEFREPRPLSR